MAKMKECTCSGMGGYEVGTFEGKTHWVLCRSCGAKTPPMPNFQAALDVWQRMQACAGPPNVSPHD